MTGVAGLDQLSPFVDISRKRRLRRGRLGDDDREFTVFECLLEECLDRSRVTHCQNDLATGISTSSDDD